MMNSKAKANLFMRLLFFIVLIYEEKYLGTSQIGVHLFLLDEKPANSYVKLLLNGQIEFQ